MVQVYSIDKTRPRSSNKSFHVNTMRPTFKNLFSWRNAPYLVRVLALHTMCTPIHTLRGVFGAKTFSRTTNNVKNERGNNLL